MRRALMTTELPAVLAAAFARRAAVERVNGDGQVDMGLQFAIGDKRDSTHVACDHGEVAAT